MGTIWVPSPAAHEGDPGGGGGAQASSGAGRGTGEKLLRCLKPNFAVLTPSVCSTLSLPLPYVSAFCFGCLLTWKELALRGCVCRSGAAPCVLPLTMSREGRAETAEQLHFGLIFYLLLEGLLTRLSDPF